MIAAGCGRSSPPEEKTPPKPFVYAERMGLANWREGRGCLASFNAALAPGTRAALVDQPPLAEVPGVREATVGERQSTACDSGLDLPYESGVSLSFYSIATAGGSSPSGLMFTILDPTTLPIVREGRVEADLDGDTVKESFRICNSSESVHFMVWTGPPAQGRPRWRGMFYVGYDMDPTCTEQDVAGMIAVDKGRN